MPLTMDIAHPNWTQWPVVRSILCVVPLYRAHFYANANADCGRGYKNLCPKYFMIFPKKSLPNMGICKKIWPNGLSLRRVSKMQLRDVDLRSIGHSIEKLWPKTFFWECVQHHFRNACNTILGMCATHFRNACNTILGMHAIPF